jgi:2-polyprenyl-3-methyl-5-hydroxy-6-metoxy-1,4-benzoquinol methylase
MQITKDSPGAVGTEERARQSKGISNDSILQMVARALSERAISGDCIADVGCGAGNFYYYVLDRFHRYIGIDAVQYEGFPAGAEFCHLDLDSGRVPLPNASADVVAAIEVIEHLENPREFVRKLVKLTIPGGWVVVTTPNQLSFLSIVTLAIKHRFQAFQDIHYPTHLTALLEIDLRRIAAECGLTNIAVDFSGSGRLPFSNRHFPRFLSNLWPRALSENVLLIGQKPLSDQESLSA